MTNDDIITYGWECEGENTQGDITDCWVNADTYGDTGHACLVFYSYNPGWDEAEMSAVITDNPYVELHNEAIDVVINPDLDDEIIAQLVDSGLVHDDFYYVEDDENNKYAVYPMTGQGEQWFVNHPHINEDITGDFQQIYDGDITVDDVYGYFDTGEDIFEM